MNKFLLTPVVAGVLTVSGVAYADSPTIYGRLYAIGTADKLETTTTDTVTNEVTKSTDDRTVFNGAGSRFGIRGSQKISDNNEFVYRLEYGATIDRASSKPTARNAFVGIKNKQYGEVNVGRIYTIDDNIDYTDRSLIFADNGGVPYSFFGHRGNNVISYTSPKISDNITVMAQYALDEGVGGGGKFRTFQNGAVTEVQRDYGAIGVTSEVDDKYFAGATYIKAGDDFSSLRVVGSYDFDKKLNAAATVQVADYNSGNKETAVLASSYYKFTEPLHGWVQAGYADNYMGYKDAEKKNVAVGGVYYFTKKVRGVASVGHGKYTEYNTDDETGNLKKLDKTSTSLDVGVRYDF